MISDDMVTQRWQGTAHQSVQTAVMVIILGKVLQHCAVPSVILAHLFQGCPDCADVALLACLALPMQRFLQIYS